MKFRLSDFYLTMTALAASAMPSVVFAYVGPGAGITAIGSLLALLAGVLLAIVGFLWYPIKRFFRSRSANKKGESTTAGKSPANPDSPEDS